ncbi:DUF885 family protein [Lentzea chajnantorensis]
MTSPADEMFQAFCDRDPVFTSVLGGARLPRVGCEMGLFSSDEQRLGMPSADAMRAARLVVDTGLHAFGGARQRAVGYLRENTAMPEPEIQSEVDRYIEVPGQALAYMIGRIEIQRLRVEAGRH